MSTDSEETFVGTVLSGPLLEPPYVFGVRAVVWAVTVSDEEAARSSGVAPFRVQLDDGRELLVQGLGAAAWLPERARLLFQRREDGGLPVSSVGPLGRGGPRTLSETRIVAWITPDERITIVGRVHEVGGPLRGVPVLTASKLRGEGAPLVAVARLAADEPSI
jgi:hypothetical protein